MLLKDYKYYFLPLAILKCSIFCNAQITPANIVYLQNFGQGTSDPNIVGPPISKGFTDFTYSNLVCPPAGSYSLVWATPPPDQSCFGGKWMFLTHDHDHEMNPLLDFGMMMLVNDTSSSSNRIVYVDTVNKNFCYDVTYKFSFSVINIDVITQCTYGPDFPVFEFRIEDDSGQLIKKDTTRPGVAASTAKKFSTYGFDFTIPNGVTTLVPKLTLLQGTYWCEEDFAVDDIMITTNGPKVNIAFDNEPGTVVKSVCFQQNETVSITGNMDAFYQNPALQWQQSIDSGITWTDIPGATTANYSRQFSTPDSFLFRLSGAEVVNIGNPNCRVVSKNLRVEVDGIPTNISATNNSPVCTGDDLIFNASGGASYIWTGPNGFSDNIQFSHIYSPALKDSGRYYVEITTLGGCITRDSTYVTMTGTDVYASPDTSICKGDSVQLKTSAGVTYSWVPVYGISNPSINDPMVKPDATTVYSATVTDSHGCSDTANVLIKVLNSTAVKAGISGSDFLCRPYDSASFKNISAGNITKWSWNFDNGQKDSTSTPSIQYYSIPDNEDGYVVRLAIADSSGCADTAYHTLKVVNNCYIAVPSAFTPNGDGLNDYLCPLNAYEATNLIFRVYNRYGQLIFETRDWTKKWDGTMKGIKQASDVYVWILEYIDVKGKKVFQKGTSVLIR